MVVTRTPTFLVPNRRTIFNNNLKHYEIHLTNRLLNLLKQCPNRTTLQQVHTQMLINSVQKPNFLLTKLVTNLKDFTYAYLVFTRIVNPTDYSFNIMIRGLTSTWQNHSLTVRLYYQMKLFGIMPNNFTYPFLFISCGNIGALDHGRIGHSMVVRTGFDGDGHVCHSMITMYARSGVLYDARKVFDGILEKDLVSWNSMISGYSKMGFAREAVGLFVEMREGGLVPDEMTFVSVLAAYGDLGDLESGKRVEGFILERKMELNSYMGSALINMYGKCGDLAAARRVFDAMAKKDVVTWNAMITGYVQNGSSHEAISLFNELREYGITPDKITLIEVLSACASVGALDLGKWVETDALQRGLQHDVFVGSALIDMYAKCGSLDNARRVFGNMPHKNEVSWNAMISALAFHGRAEEALSLFRCMTKNSGVACPNDITFIGVLSACVHAGLIDEGLGLFNSMISSFGLVPKIEHYSCMVDLLARGGHLNEAWNIIEKMPGKPDAILLGALLSSCQKRKNVEVSERVIQLLLDSEPSNSGNYVISSKIYSKLRKWDESAKMRVLMRQKGVVKTPGCSWIEIECQVYEFHAGDDLPCQSMEMYQFLKEEMKKEGFNDEVDIIWRVPVHLQMQF